MKDCKTCKHCEVNLYRLRDCNHTYADMCSAPQLLIRMDTLPNGHQNKFIAAQDCRDLLALCGTAAHWYEHGHPKSVDGIRFREDGTWGSDHPLPDYMNRKVME